MNINSSKIEFRNLRKTFGSKIVLNGIDLRVQSGESVVVIGGSGSGKSVMLKCLLGLLSPDSGSIKVDGEEVIGLSTRDRDRVNRKFGMLFQSAALFDSLPVWENVAFGLIQGQRMKHCQARKVALERMAQVGLASEIAELQPAALSGGMRKRVGLARAIATAPEIVLFDEPTTGLDPIMADIINDLIVKCVKELGTTTLSITHDMTSARKIADRIAMLYKGRLIWSGPAADVTHSGNPYVEQFVHGCADGPIAIDGQQ
ncbi:Methionine ABC transporter ATP-binding protein [invertebrate metagenome]|uniref:Methionine ABC transporter ATP-binding protein n=1 Tax=invertebrate metagenome TaxID=1711999 RepID=A0A484HC05_9ZZZZ